MGSQDQVQRRRRPRADVWVRRVVGVTLTEVQWRELERKARAESRSLGGQISMTLIESLERSRTGV